MYKYLHDQLLSLKQVQVVWPGVLLPSCNCDKDLWGIWTQLRTLNV